MNDKPDLIISDIKMPGMHGYDLLKHIKNNYDKLPVIIMTAFTDMQAAIDAYGVVLLNIFQNLLI